jgi:hypothetical protein
MDKLEFKKSYCITWLDHFSDDMGWVEDCEIEKKSDIQTVKSIGFFIGEDNIYLTIAMNIGTEDSSVFMKILKSCVTDIEFIDLKTAFARKVEVIND